MEKFILSICFCTLLFGSKAQSDLLINGIYAKSISINNQNEIVIGGANSTQACLLKLSNSNSVLFSKQYSGIDFFWDVETYNNSIYALANNGNPVILKTDANGNVSWMKEAANLAGTYHCRMKIKGDSLFMGIQTNNQITAVCFDTSGNLHWSKSFPISVSAGYPFSCDIFKSGSFTYLIHSNTFDLGVIKLNENGDFIWHKEYEFSSPMNIKCINKSIVQNSNEFVLSGSLQSDPFLVKIDSSGQFIFAKQISHPGYVLNFSESVVFYNNKYYLAGHHDDNLTTYTKKRYYLTEADAALNFIQQIDMGNWSSMNFFNHELIHTGNEFMFLRSNTGDSSELLRFQNLNQIICDTLHTAAVIIDHPVDTLINHYDTLPAIVFNSIATTASSVVFSFQNECPMMSTFEKTNTAFLSIHPNPNNGVFDIEFPPYSGNLLLEIYNSTGQIIYQQKAGFAKNTINLKENSSGIYIIVVRTEKEIIFRNKFIIE